MNVYVLIKNEEGFRASPYLCSEGYPTVGYGHRIGPKGAALEDYDFTMPEPVADEWLRHHIDSIVDSLSACAWYEKADEVRQAAFVSMAYQMGFAGVMKFRKMIAAACLPDWDEAADQALDSRWAKQTPARAHRTAEMIRTGSWPAGLS